MATEIEYTSDVPAKDVLAKFKHRSACAEAMTWCNQHASKTWGGLTDAVIDDKFDQSWGVWYLVIYGEKTHPDIRKKLILRIKDPMMAFNIYCRLAWLTDEEDKLLKEKFRGKLPLAEAELSSGIAKRAKSNV